MEDQDLDLKMGAAFKRNAPEFAPEELAPVDRPSALRPAPKKTRGRSLRPLVVGAAVVVIIAGAGVAAWAAFSHGRGDGHVVVITDGPGVSSSGGSGIAAFADGEWEFHADRAASLDAVRLPSDELSEDIYNLIPDPPVYRITVSQNGARVSIKDEGAQGDPGADATRKSLDETSVRYDLAAAPGGRLVVWSTGAGLQAEFTQYGSGLPMIFSYRGTLQRIQLTAAEAATLERIRQIRAGLADGTWEFAPTATSPDSSADGGEAPQITVYLKDPPTDVDALQQDILAMPDVASVVYVSKEEALARLREDFKDDPDILEDLTGNPLPASFEVSLKDANADAVSRVTQNLQGRAEVDEVRAQEAGEGMYAQISPETSPTETLDELERGLYGPDLTVYLKTSAEQSVQSLSADIAAMPGVARVQYRTADQNLADLKKDFEDDPEILDGLTGNPLPATVKIWLTDATQATALEQTLRARSQVDEVYIEAASKYAEFFLDMFHRK